jgi:hypothetical protein
MGKRKVVNATLSPTDRPSRSRTTVNWVLVLLTIPAAAAIVILAYGAVMSTSGCSPGRCEHLPSETQFSVLLYAAPVISAVAVLMSVLTARRPHGYLVPVIAWLLLIANVAAMMYGFQR